MREKIRVSEIFLSIEGEGPYTGRPTIFVRTFGCNFTCSGFNNPDKQPITFQSAESLSKVKLGTGCDSAYSWHPTFKSLARDYTIEELADEILRLCEGYAQHCAELPILCFTGGEPMLWQTQIAQLLELLGRADQEHQADVAPRKILIETNCSIAVEDDLYFALMPYDVVWANSPKLSLSGEPWEKAINPTALRSQRPPQRNVEHYLKFVSDGSDASFEEIERALVAYSLDTDYWYRRYRKQTWVMPVGTTFEQQKLVQRRVAEQCIKRGLKFCARVHCFVFDNEPGT